MVTKKNLNIKEIAAYTKVLMANNEGGHDWWHVFRVWQNALNIAVGEGNVDQNVVELAAILHDIADSKFHNGDEEIGPKMAADIMAEFNVSTDISDQVTNIIKHMSFKNSFESSTWTSKELLIVQDADRLDAIGAIGIARAFSYGGFKNRLMFDPDTPPMVNMTKEQYKKSAAPTINHFYEKLLKLKDMMNTTTGQKMAQQRHQFMTSFLDQFYDEAGVVPDWHKTD